YTKERISSKSKRKPSAAPAFDEEKAKREREIISKNQKAVTELLEKEQKEKEQKEKEQKEEKYEIPQIARNLYPETSSDFDILKGVTKQLNRIVPPFRTIDPRILLKNKQKYYD